jgi:hypothetical protein
MDGFQCGHRTWHIPAAARARRALTVLRGLLLLSALLCTAASARAQTVCTATGLPAACSFTAFTLSLTVVRTIRITVTPSAANLGSPTAADFERGYSETLGHTVSIRANSNWQVQISSPQAAWTASGPGARVDKPRSNLLWATSATGAYTALNGTETTLASGTQTSLSSVPLYYRVLWAWAADPPGTYSLPVTLRIIAP